MINRVKDYLLREQYRPTIIGFFINPFFYGRYSLNNHIKKMSVLIKGEVLDVGCGSKPYQDIFSRAKNYIGLDVEQSGHNSNSKKADVFYDGIHFPFSGESFDSAVCFEVLEHVFNPEIFLGEINRVLKDGGTLLITVPFIWDEHEQPYDYARYSSFGLKYLFNKSGFRIIEHSKYLNDLRMISLLINVYFYKTFRRFFPGVIAWFFILFFTIPVNLLGLISFLFPKNDDLYFGNIFLLKKDNPITKQPV